MALDTITNSDQRKMRSVMFYVFLAIFVVLTFLTILSLFFGLTKLKEQYQSTLVITFVIEVGVAIAALFYGLFGLKKTDENTGDEKKPEADALTLLQKNNPVQPVLDMDIFLNQVITDELVREQTFTLVEELKKLKTIKNPLFQKAISIDYTEFLSEVKNWVRSCVKIQGSENDEFLITIYQGASQNVFSTCIMDYFNAWETDFGNMLLEAHRNNSNCDTKRVFIFHSRDEITGEIFALINKQVDYAVKPYILIDESNEFDDFTIIDNGEVIGVTNEMKYGKRLTTWYFDESHQRKRFLAKKDTIIHKSIPAANFKLNKP